MIWRALFVACLFPAVSFAAMPTLPDVLNKLESTEKTIQSVSFHVVQDIVFTQTGQTTQMDANAWFAKGGKMRIEKRQPDQQITVSDGKTVWIFNPKPNQVWQGAAKSWLKAGWLPKGMIPVGGYVSELKKNFDLSVVSATDEDVTLDASPKDMRLGYKLQLTFSTSTWLPTKTLYVSDSARVSTQLSGLAINPDNAAQQFRFPIPKGATVIPLN